MVVNFNFLNKSSNRTFKNSYVNFRNRTYDYSVLDREFEEFIKGNNYDEFVAQPTKCTKKIDPTNDGKFSFWQAAKNFGKGLISPITVIFKHPLMTLATVAAVGAACFFVPVLTPILTLGFGALSVFHLGKALYNTGKNIARGNYDEAEKGFENIGSGVTATALTVLGIKQGAKIAAEAKAASAAGTNSLSAVKRTEIAQKVAGMGYKDALKENLSLFTSKEGYKAIFSQFKPSALVERWNVLKGLWQNLNKFRKVMKAKGDVQKVRMEEFKKSPEGLRRAALTDEQIQAEATAKFNQAFDELGIPKEQRPKLVITPEDNLKGGSYCRQDHVINYNPQSYRNGYFEIDETIMHEATHCKEALLRAGLPKEKVTQIVAEDLSNRIINGEAEQIIVRGNVLQPDMMQAPKLPDPMKHDFVQFSKKHLFTDNQDLYTNLKKIDDAKSSIRFNQSKIDGKITGEIAEATSSIKRATTEVIQCREKISPVIQELEAMIKKYPEFASQYKSPEEALSVLEQYALSHNFRYRTLTNTQIQGITPTQLTAEQVLQAEKSLRGYVDTMEGNAGISGLRGFMASDNNFNHYQFSPEEVLAQQNGNRFLINNFKTQMEQMRASGTLTPEKEAIFTAAIQKAEATIAYKTKGLEYYKLYTKMINNPQDKELAKLVVQLKAELGELASKMNPEEIQKVNQIIGLTTTNPSNILPAINILSE